MVIIFHILSKIFFLKSEELSDARVPLITKSKYGFAVHFFIDLNFESQYLTNDKMRFLEALFCLKFS